jgi:hypothetical protein
MGRRKKTEIADKIRIKEICQNYGVDPFEESVKIALEKVRIPTGTDPELLGKLMRQYQERYELVLKDEDGWVFQTRQDIRLRVWEGATKFVYPQLKATETKEEKDFNLTVTVKQFTVNQPPQTVLVDSGRKELPEVVEVVEAEVE